MSTIKRQLDGDSWMSWAAAQRLTPNQVYPSPFPNRVFQRILECISDEPQRIDDIALADAISANKNGQRRKL